ncbi:DUF4062 domain-containing protein [Xylanibacillus composti]|uniref:DUF4062 domain-containing protein n=1 Tax=Xylanibacillus composti TaxID=1572762 RepID=A0A8J4H7V0_9BACL|nr:DUF4062 domain-containing protein [Xylanibacillus composti]MDT9726766.1 DUF4062 domain-containing protein [Xylanibacillus composti]GIQ71472.1 DUF4062 domain-containing protein [Xylanibacillus composti]
MLTLFISSTIRDMQVVRRTLSNQIEQQLGHQVKLSESISFDWTGEDIIQSCLREVERADIYVLMIGSQSGMMIPDHGISVTRAEYRKAKALRKPILALILYETWVLYRQASDRLSPGIVEFIDEVSQNFGRYFFKFSVSEEAAEIVRAQLSLLLKSYLQLNRSVREIQDSMEKEEAAQAYYRFVQALFRYDQDDDRVLSILAQAMKTGDIFNQEYIPQPIVHLSAVTGAALYRLLESQGELALVGCTGDADCQPAYRTDDGSSYVSVTYACNEAKLYEKETSYDMKEMIACFPMGGKYVLALHVLTKLEYTPAYDRQLVLDQLYGENKAILHTLHLYLERRGRS